MIEVGSRVTYQGSLTQYHKWRNKPMPFTVLALFDFQGVPCARLQGPKLDIWIERCRVSNLTLIEDDDGMS